MQQYTPVSKANKFAHSFAVQTLHFTIICGKSTDSGMTEGYLGFYLTRTRCGQVVAMHHMKITIPSLTVIYL